MTKLIILLFFSLIFCTSYAAVAPAQLYIMLNVDKTIVDRIQGCDPKVIDSLKKQNIAVQQLKFIANKDWSLYKRLADGQELINESKYMSQIQVQEILPNQFSITECVAIRPAMKILLEQLEQLKIPVTILITSRNDDTRTANLQKHLNLEVAGKKFSHITKVVPRNYFRIKPKDISLKSAAELRKNLKYIKPDDFVILLDHLHSSRFVKSSPNRDLNIFVSKFSLEQTYDYNKDKLEMQAIINQINDFITE
jgi:hypothetical protein